MNRVPSDSLRPARRIQLDISQLTTRDSLENSAWSVCDAYDIPDPWHACNLFPSSCSHLPRLYCI